MVFLPEIVKNLGFSIGRDALFTLLRDNGLLIRPHRKPGPKTTDARLWARQYPDLVNRQNLSINQSVWVTDITYLPIADRFVYVSMITDLRSRKIIGYHVSNSMETKRLCLPALEMAIASQKPENRLGIIHHSDRGRQYLDKAYTGLLKSEGLLISMTQSGDPLDNAVAERVNGIIKNEYLFAKHKSLQSVQKALKTSIDLYNMERPHESLHMQTPHQIWLLNQNKP
jgi:putative transposase